MKKPRKKKQQPKPSQAGSGLSGQPQLAVAAGSTGTSVRGVSGAGCNGLRGDDLEPVFSSARPFPVLLVALLAILFYQADMYLMEHSGGFSALVYYPFKTVPEPPGGGDMVKLGQNIFGRNCAACHQVNGAGNAALGFPPLAGSDWVAAEGPNRLIRIVLNGLSGPIEVNGQQYNNAMVPWRDTMSDKEIAAVLTYVRQAWGNTAPPVKPEQVAAIRQATESRGARNWSAQELLAIPVSD